MMLNLALKLETAAALAVAWVVVFVVPARWARDRLVAAAGPGSVGSEKADARAAAAARRVARLAPRMPFATTCLVRAVAGALLLRRRGLRDVTIRLGVRRSGGTLEAHAWLIHGGVVLLGGGETLDGYTPLADLQVDRPAGG